MATKPNASLASLDLTNLHVPLAGRDRDPVVELPQPERMPPQASKPTPIAPRRATSAERETPAPRKREHLIPYSIRLPLSMVNTLDELKKEDYVITELVRDFIAQGLKAMGVKEPK